MEQIQTQASDLRYLTQGSVALSDSASVYSTPRPGPHDSPSGSAAYGDNSAAAENASKRPLVDDGAAAQRPTRSKRNRYISLACNECKRRKIKCNGETPCQRCGNLSLNCLYASSCCPSFKDSDEFKDLSAHLSRLQDEVAELKRAMHSVQNNQAETSRLAPMSNDRVTNRATPSTLAPSPPQSSTLMHPPATPQNRGVSFRGPTSMAFNLDIANSTFSNMWNRSVDESHEQDPRASKVPVRTPPTPGHDPLFEFEKDEMVRLCRFHEDEIGIMYPVLDMHDVIAHAKAMTPFWDSIRNRRHSPETINDEKTLQLKMIMCCALVVEGHGQSERAERLYNSMEGVVNRKLMSDTSEVTNLPLLCLLAGYRFLSNDEILAWRVIGQVMRLCLELGLHQCQGLNAIQNEADRKNTLNCFWSAYVLDRRWAFGTGLPFAVQDDQIDSNLPMPEAFPFLVAMVSYSRIGAKVWREVSQFSSVWDCELRREEIDRLDSEILSWYDTVPDEVKVHSLEEIMATTSYNLKRLKIWTWLRLNQIRIWLYTPILHSATSIMKNLELARRVVDLAKDTIRYLSDLNSTTNLYRRAQVFYHQFLASAIAVVFLAAVHSPVQFSAECRTEFYLALELVEDLSAKSWVSQRLWKTIKSLREMAPRLGLDPEDDAHSNAALGIMDLSQSRMDGGPLANQPSFSRFGPTPGLPNGPSPGGQIHQNGKRIRNEMSNLFEVYSGSNMFTFAEERPPLTPDAAAPLLRPAETVFSQLKEMF